VLLSFTFIIFGAAINDLYYSPKLNKKIIQPTFRLKYISLWYKKEKPG